VDEVVPQFYDLQDSGSIVGPSMIAAPIDAAKWAPLFNRHGKRFRIGVSTFGRSKLLPPGRPNGYWESYKSEIAAYELDKLLDMRMVPVAVEKTLNHDKGAAILWLSPIHSWKEMEPKPKPGKWVHQVARMKMFDDLICNKDRNAGNLLVDDDWNLYLIDHSRAFIGDKDLAVKMEHVDREFWDRIQALDEGQLTSALSKWVDKGGIRAMLTRRERMKAEIEKLVAANGEAAVFLK
jgi:hypothetical protein